MKGPSAPKPPNPQVTANAQTRSNIDTATANLLMQGNQVTPWGSQTTSQTGTTRVKIGGKLYKIPQMTSTTTLDPAQQGLLNQQTANNRTIANVGAKQALQMGSILGRPISAPTLGQVGAGPNLATSYAGADDFSADRGRVEEALMSRMNPALAQARSAREAQLSNQGIKIGTEAYDRAMTQLGQNENDANMQAILAGGQEQSRMVGLARDAAMFGNDSRQQMFDNNMARAGFNNDVLQQGFLNQQGLRSGAINEANALRGGGQVGMPQFAGMQTPTMPNTDMAGLINNQYQGNLANWQQQQQNRQQMMGGLFGLGSALIMASDERLKENIEPVGAEVDGIPVHSYTYKGDPETMHVGVLAQDVLKKKPEAVVPMGKYLGVNYAKLGA